ncbi:hypothetical protein LXL04_006665 [Taraxacum kok-saghyz]
MVRDVLVDACRRARISAKKEAHGPRTGSESPVTPPSTSRNQLFQIKTCVHKGTEYGRWKGKKVRYVIEVEDGVVGLEWRLQQFGEIGYVPKCDPLTHEPETDP